MSSGPLDRYRAHLGSGRLKPDPEQARVAEALDSLHRALRHYRPARDAWWRSLFGMGGSDGAPNHALATPMTRGAR